MGQRRIKFLLAIALAAPLGQVPLAQAANFNGYVQENISTATIIANATTTSSTSPRW